MSQIWKIWKLAYSYKVWYSTTLIIGMLLFQRIFAHIWGISYWNVERFFQNAFTRSIFDIEKCSFFISNGLKFCKKLIGTNGITTKRPPSRKASCKKASLKKASSKKASCKKANYLKKASTNFLDWFTFYIAFFY